MGTETLGRGEREMLRIFALVFAAALAIRLRPPSDPTTARLALWLLVATLLIAMPIAVAALSFDFGVHVDELGVRCESAWGRTVTPWNEIASFEFGRGWIAPIARLYIVRTDGQRIALRPLEARRWRLEDARARLERHRRAWEVPGRQVPPRASRGAYL